jgi:hypothetical protein
MTGDLIEPDLGLQGSSEPRLLQKPFRISDVLTLIRDVYTARRLEKVKG